MDNQSRVIRLANDICKFDEKNTYIRTPKGHEELVRFCEEKIRGGNIKVISIDGLPIGSTNGLYGVLYVTPYCINQADCVYINKEGGYFIDTFKKEVVKNAVCYYKHDTSPKIEIG